MLIYLYGPDTYRRGRYVRTQLLDPYRKKYPDGTVAFFDLEQDGVLTRLRDFASGGGLFAKVTLAVVSNPAEARSAGSGRGEKEFAKFLKEKVDDAHSTIIVVSDKKLPKDFAVLGAGKEFEPLEGIEFLKFIKAEAKARELTVTDAQLKAIGEAYDGDTWAAMTEIECVSSGGAVEKFSPEIDSFGLIKTLSGSRDQAQRLRALTLLIDYDEPAKVFNLLAAFVFGGNKIKMADYDLDVKSGRLEYPDVLLDYILTSA
jgi:hypothetical protein